MATYKVIQDIEAEDKLVGPLTLRQFIYAAVSAVCLYICFLCFTKGAEFLIGIFLPIAAVGGFFAFPWKGEQPTELWALARIRFMIKPRVRIWDQEGAKDLVTITVPRKLKTERQVRPALSQVEVRSRLKALADTIDSRGWATRNAAFGAYQQSWTKPSLVPAMANPGMSAMIPDDDMFSEGNAVSQNLDAMLAKSQQDQRQRVMNSMATAQAPPSKLASLPNIPTPAASSAYSVAPAPAPMPMPAGQPQMMQQGQMPGMQQPANHWFANGPAYPTNPMPSMPQMMAPPNAMPMNPMMGQQPMPMGQMPMQMPAAMQAPAVNRAMQQQQQHQAQGSVPPLPRVALPSLPQPAVNQPVAANPSPNPNPIAGPMMPMPGPGPMPMPMSPSMPAPASPPPAFATDPRIESDMPLAVSATPTAADDALAQEIKQQNDAVVVNYGHMRVLRPAGQADDSAQNGGQPTIDQYPAMATPDGMPAGDQYVNGATPEAPQPVTAPTNPAILDLANNDDLDIATIARQANREMNKTPDEVEIRLH